MKLLKLLENFARGRLWDLNWQVTNFPDDNISYANYEIKKERERKKSKGEIMNCALIAD